VTGREPLEKAELASDVWRTIVDFFWASREQSAQVLQELNITPGHMKTLLLLDPLEPKPMGALAEAMSCDASNVTWLVDRLEERGLVERRMLETDRRVKTVRLTALGAKTKKSLLERLYEPPEALLALDRRDLESLKSSVSKLPVIESALGL